MLYADLQLRKPETISEMFNVARKVALAEGSAQESQYRKKERQSEASPLERRGKNRTRKTETFTSLNVPKESLITIIKEKYRVCDPTPMQTQAMPARDKSKFCRFHQDYEHMTENCIQLKRAIERLIRDGHLKEYISEKTKGQA